MQNACRRFTSPVLGMCTYTTLLVKYSNYLKSINVPIVLNVKTISIGRTEKENHFSTQAKSFILCPQNISN